MMLQSHKFRILKIQDGGRICTETSRPQMLQSIVRGWSLSPPPSG